MLTCLICGGDLQQDTAEVTELLREPPKGWSASLVASRPQRVLRHLILAQILIDDQKIDEAESLVLVAHEFVHNRTIPGNYFIGVADQVMGNWLAAKGQVSEAESCLLAAVDNLRTSRGPTHRLTMSALESLKQLYRTTGRMNDLERLDEK